MATKPTDTVPIWASNANWSTGPSAGSPTKIDTTPYAPDGHIEGVATPSRADVMNGFQNPVSKWCQWVEAGSSAGAADAHIVETDSAGKTTVKALAVTGPASGNTVTVTKVAASTDAVAISGTGGTVTLMGGSETILCEVGGSIDGFLASVTGDHVPYNMAAQTTAPTTFYNGYVPLFAVQSTVGGNTGTTLNTALRSTREYIPTFASQYLRRTVYDSGISVSPGGGETDIFTGVQWVTRKMPHAANTPLLFTLTFEYSGGTVADPIDVFIYNGASPVGAARRFYPQNTNTNNETIRVIYASGSLAGASDSYRVAMTATLGIDIDEAVLTIETTE